MDDYETLKKIGDGTFGTVYLCRKRTQKSASDGNEASRENTSTDKAGSALCAIKKMKKRYYNWEECLKLREINALKKLQHKNIILLKEVIREDNHLYLVFEHMEQNLYQLIRAQLIPFPETTIKKIVLQIVDGLAYMHERGFFHRDIKPENLLCKNGADSIKIADFGLNREIDSCPPYTDYVSTRWYRAPELLLHSTQYNWTVDIWAVGCITGELYMLKPMFPGRSEIDQIFKVCQLIGAPKSSDWPEGQRLASLIQFNFPNLIPMNLSEVLSGCSEDGVNLMESILRWMPSERPSAKVIKNHLYFV